MNWYVVNPIPTSRLAPDPLGSGASALFDIAAGILPMAQNSVLVVEDEEDIRSVLQLNLAAEGLHVVACGDGLDGLQQARALQPQLVLLDLMLPGLDGLEVCRELKAAAETRHIQVIMLTAKGRESDVVLGLGLGADDYVTKPFSIAELVARVKVALRRSREAATEHKSARLSFGAVVLDLAAHSLHLDGQPVELTATEFRLLWTLASQPQRVFSRQLLVRQAIGTDVYVHERTIDTHLGALRRKLGPYRGWIRTVWGVGYRFEPQEQG